MIIWSSSPFGLLLHLISFFMECFNNFSLLSWNIRGAFSHDAKRKVRDLISNHHPSVFCVYETHGPFVKVEKFWHSMGFKPLFLQEAIGHSGGIWILTSIDDVVFTLMDSMRQAIPFSIQKCNKIWFCM